MLPIVPVPVALLAVVELVLAEVLDESVELIEPLLPVAVFMQFVLLPLRRDLVKDRSFVAPLAFAVLS